MSLLELDRVTVRYTRSGGFRKPAQVLLAANEVSLGIAPGEALGLVGESGSGKSTVAQAIEGLVPVRSGSIKLDGQDLVTMSRKQRRATRRRMQMVFQDPYSSLDPSMSIESTLVEPLRVHHIAKGAEAANRAAAAMESVGLRAADLAKYPHEFSGGQRQRIAIARALMPEPELLILDEAVSALDVSTRAQILQLLMDLRKARGLAFLFIGHDLAVVRRMSERIAVMYLGRVVETGPAEHVIRKPEHPYTAALLASVPQVGQRLSKNEFKVRIDPPDPWNPLPGCAFATRCPFVMEVCRTTAPPVVPIGDSTSRCHLPVENADIRDARLSKTEKGH